MRLSVNNQSQVEQECTQTQPSAVIVMQLVREAMPKAEGAVETALPLKKYSYEAVKPVVPEPLERLPAATRPVAEPAAEHPEAGADETTPQIIDLLRGNRPARTY